MITVQIVLIDGWTGYHTVCALCTRAVPGWCMTIQCQPTCVTRPLESQPQHYCMSFHVPQVEQEDMARNARSLSVLSVFVLVCVYICHEDAKVGRIMARSNYSICDSVCWIDRGGKIITSADQNNFSANFALFHVPVSRLL